MRLAVFGNTSRDIVSGGTPRTGGAPFHAARALRLLGARATVVTRCAESDRTALIPALTRLGLPVVWGPAEHTATFAFSYDGDRRQMTVEEVGDPWTVPFTRGLAGAALVRIDWLHVGALAASDFPPDTLAALARGRRLSYDGQGLVRPARTGPLVLEGTADPDVLRHVTILKLAEEEAAALLGEGWEGELRSLGVAEVVVTLGSRGSVVLAGKRVERVPARALPVEPTGAGDAFCAAYLVARAGGHNPVSAARRATVTVAATLGGAR